MAKTAREIRKEREQRVMDAIQMKSTDRVPVLSAIGYFAARYTGIPFSAAYYDYNAWYAAYEKTLHDFQPDMIYPQGFSSGKALEILEPKQMKWPGYGVDPYESHQSIEVDNMKADEYDLYMKDLSDYMLRIHIPRTSTKLEGLALLPKLSDLGAGAMGAQGLAVVLADPKVSKSIQTLQKAGREMRKWHTRTARFNKLIHDMSFPDLFQGAAMPPYDVLSNSMRGMSGTVSLTKSRRCVSSSSRKLWIGQCLSRVRTVIPGFL
jgi:hypothetical protein